MVIRLEGRLEVVNIFRKKKGYRFIGRVSRINNLSYAFVINRCSEEYLDQDVLARFHSFSGVGRDYISANLITPDIPVDFPVEKGLRNWELCIMGGIGKRNEVFK